MRRGLLLGGVVTISALLLSGVPDDLRQVPFSGISSSSHSSSEVVAVAAGAAMSVPNPEVAVGESISGSGYYPPPESQGGWRRLVVTNRSPTAAERVSILTEAGLDSSKLSKAWQYVERFGHKQALLVIRHGWIAGDWDNVGIGPVNSATKSIAGLAMAKAFELSDAGRLVTTIEPESYAYRYLPPAWANADSRRRLIKIKHLTTMTSGLEDSRRLPALSLSVAHPPETYYQYNSGDIVLGAMALENAVGQSFGNFVIGQIAKPIRAESIWFWPDRSAASATGGAFMSTRDFARIGYLVMRNGTWNDGSGLHQVIGASYIRTMLQRPSFLDHVKEGRRQPGTEFSPSDPDHRFLITSGTWWLNRANALSSVNSVWPSVPEDAVGMHGYGKDFCLIIPSLDMVIVHQTERSIEAVVSANLDFLPTLLSMVMSSVSDPPVPAGNSPRETRR